MTKDELIEKTEKAIVELVHEKKDLLKAYNYYNGERDPDLFKYLEENFGLGNPTSIEFIPLLRKHVDALVGEYLGTPIIPKVLCKDSETIASIGREKQLKLMQEIYSYLTNLLNNDIISILGGKETKDPLIELQIKKITDEINVSFVSEYEIAAQNVIEYIMQSRNTDMITNLRILFLDLLITGTTYYKVEPSPGETNIKIRPLNPLNVFTDENVDSPYIKDSHRVVVRTWMTKNQILNKYGKDLTRDEIKSIKELMDTWDDGSSYYFKHGVTGSRGILAGTEIAIPPGIPTTNSRLAMELFPVYEVEWIETDKNFVMLRYETVRIGEDIYILKGKNEEVIRSKDNPTYCSLSVNGIRFLNRGTHPYSLMLSCSALLDRYDILHFYRDRLIASSGTTGDFVDVSLLPLFLGDSMPERLLKFIAYKKGGIAPFDSSQPGRLEMGMSGALNWMAGFDDTLKAQAVQAILIAIDSIELTVSSITGVFRERLNGIEQRDAVSNVRQGVNNSFIITKQYYHQMDLVVNEMLVDCLNLAKRVYKNGLTGTLILGDKYLKIFTALPEYFTLTDYDIRIITSSDILKDLEYMRLTIPQLAQQGVFTPDIILEALTAKSMTELKTKARISMQKQEEKNNVIQLLQLKLQEVETQAKQATQQLEQALKKIEQLNESKMQLEQQKMQLEYKVDWFKAQTDRTYKQEMAAEAKRRTEVEFAQLYDGNPYNDRIRQLG